jgi:filamentous hemagglutinin
MEQGQKVEYIYKRGRRTGFIQFTGNRLNGQSKFGFVGTNSDGAITTIHIESGNSFWKMLSIGDVDKVIRPKP